MPVPAGTTGHSFFLTCLGPVGLVSATGAKVGVRTRKQTALLLLLARRPGELLLKDHLLDLLWSEDDEASARHSLSQSVSLLNKALGREAVTAPGKDQLSLERGLVWLDVTAFEAHVAAQQPTEARALWRGNLLDGFRLQRAPNFERWVDLERERLARLMRGVLHDAAEAERAAG
ncbi:MAG: winged helix-turn-helix domain-containing protein, partial [Gemmatimonadota bacterium]